MATSGNYLSIDTRTARTARSASSRSRRCTPRDCTARRAFRRDLVCRWSSDATFLMRKCPSSGTQVKVGNGLTAAAPHATAASRAWPPVTALGATREWRRSATTLALLTKHRHQPCSLASVAAPLASAACRPSMEPGFRRLVRRLRAWTSYDPSMGRRPDVDPRRRGSASQSHPNARFPGCETSGSGSVGDPVGALVPRGASNGRVSGTGRQPRHVPTRAHETLPPPAPMVPRSRRSVT